MPIEIGSEIEGKVTAVKTFGAFMELPEGKVGLVHVSQISDSYVTDITKHVKVGDVIKVKVLAANKDGKYDLSIKQVGKVNWQMPRRKKREDKDRPAPGSFEDKITQFMKQSEEKLADWKRNIDSKQGVRKNKY